MLQDQMPKHNINDVIYTQTWSQYNKCVIAGIRVSSVLKCLYLSRAVYIKGETPFQPDECEYQVYRVLSDNQLQEWGWTSERDIITTREEFIDKYGTDPELIYQTAVAAES